MTDRTPAASNASSLPMHEVGVDDRVECQCPRCGRLHWKIADDPPASIRQPNTSDLERAGEIVTEYMEDFYKPAADALIREFAEAGARTSARAEWRPISEA